MIQPINPSDAVNPADRIKALEQVLAVAKSSFEYFESSVRQVEDKSRSNLTLGTGVVGIGAVIAKTDVLVNYLRPIQQLVKDADPIIVYAPSVWVFVAIIPLLFATSFLLYLSYLHFQVQGRRVYEVVDPDVLHEYREGVNKSVNPEVLRVTIVGMITAYATSGKAAKLAFATKTKYLPRQEQVLVGIFWSTTIYIVASLILIATIPGLK